MPAKSNRKKQARPRDDPIKSDDGKKSSAESDNRENKKARLTVCVGGEKLLVPMPDGPVSDLIKEIERRAGQTAVNTVSVDELRIGSPTGGILESTAGCSTVLRDGDRLFAISAAASSGSSAEKPMTDAAKQSDSDDTKTALAVPMSIDDRIEIAYVTASNPIPRSIGYVNKNDCRPDRLMRLIAAAEAASIGLPPVPLPPFPGDSTSADRKQPTTAAGKLVADHADAVDKSDKTAAVSRLCVCQKADRIRRLIPVDAVKPERTAEPKPKNCAYCHTALSAVCSSVCKTAKNDDLKTCPLVVGRTCGHQVHAHCMSEWRSKNSICPECATRWSYLTTSSVSEPRLRVILTNDDDDTGTDDSKRSTDDERSTDDAVIVPAGNDAANVDTVRSMVARLPRSTDVPMQLWSRSVNYGGQPVVGSETPWKSDDDCVLSFCGGSAHAVPIVVSIKRPDGRTMQLATEDLTTQSTVQDCLLVLQQMDGTVPDDVQVVLEAGSVVVRSDCPLWRLAGPSTVLELQIIPAVLSAIWIGLFSYGCRIPNGLTADETIALLQADTVNNDTKQTDTVNNDNKQAEQQQRFVVYAVCRRVRSDSLIVDQTGRGDGGWQASFVNCAAWRPTIPVRMITKPDSKTPVADDPKTVGPKAMSTYLSTLYQLASSLSGKSDKRQQAIGRWRVLVRDFAPAVSAFRRLVFRRNLTDIDKSVLTAAVYAFGRSVVPAKVDDADVLLHTRALMAYVMASATLDDQIADAGRFRTVSLIDGGNDGGNDGQRNRIREPERAVGMPNMLRCAAAVRDAAAKTTASTPTTTTTEPTKTTTEPTKTTTEPTKTTTEPTKAYEWRSCPLTRAWLAAAGSADEIDIELPGPTVVSVSTTVVPVSTTVPAKPLNWPSIVATGRKEPSMAVVAPLALAGAPRPSLTKDDVGQLAVFTGRGKDVAASTDLFCPCRGGERSVDVQKVAAALAALGTDDQDESDMMVQRPPNEAILVCLDVSNSMSATAGFTEDDAKIGMMAEDSDDEAETIASKDPVSVIWQSSNRDESKLTDAEKKELDGGLSDMKRHRNFADFCALASLLGAREFMVEYCRMTEANRHYYGNRYAFTKAASVGRGRYFALLKTDTKTTEPNGKSTTDIDSTVPPSDIICPLTRTVITDPAMYSDGVVYDRTTIRRWLTAHGGSSPMTGEPDIQPLHTDANDGLQAKIDAWNATVAEAENRKRTKLLDDTKTASKAMPNRSSEIVKTATAASAAAAAASTDGSNVWINTSFNDTDKPTGDKESFWLAMKRYNGPELRIAARPRMSLGELRRNAAGLFNVSDWRLLRLIHAGNFLEQSARPLKSLDIDGKSLIFVADGPPPAVLPSESSSSSATTISKPSSSAAGSKPKPLTTEAYVDPAGPRVCIQVVNRCASPKGEFTLAVERDEPIESIKIRIWRAAVYTGPILGARLRPTVMSLKTKPKSVGDGYISSPQISDYGTIGRYLNADPPTADRLGIVKESDADRQQFLFGGYANRPAMFTKPVNIWIWREKPAEAKDSKLTRIQVAQQLFHAFVNRQQAYNYSKHLGLTLFGSESKQACGMTPLYDNFRKHVDNASVDGGTALYDALNDGIAVLEAVRSKHPDVLLRILVLSDGKDTSSTKTQAYTVANRLQTSNIVVDAIQIGAEREHTLAAIVKATGGLCFTPKTIAECVTICELETVLCRHERPAVKKSTTIVSGFDLQRLAMYGVRYDSCANDDAPERRSEPRLDSVVVSLPAAIKRNADSKSDATVETESKPSSSSSSASSSSSNPNQNRSRRIMAEMRRLDSARHPGFDVFPSETDIGFWKVVVDGPDSTPYNGGAWLLSVQFPADYPDSPPDVRFVTPMLHMNVSRYGKICFSLLDRNWSADTTMREVLDGLYGLLLNPDHADPLNTTLALSYHNADGTYQAKILEHVRQHAAVPRAKLAAKIESGDRSAGKPSSSSSSSVSYDIPSSPPASDNDDDTY